MRTRTVHMATAVLSMGLLAACSEAGPTAPEDSTTLHLTPAAAEVPGRLTEGEIPETGLLAGTIPDQVVCGISPVTVSFFDAGATWPGAVPGEPPIRATGLNVIRWTNDANGRWIESLLAGHETQQMIGLHNDGTFRIRRRYSHTVRLRGATGPAYALSAGTWILEFTVVPLDGGDFVITDVEFLFEGGPKDAPPLDSPPFCEIVTAVLNS